MSDEPRDPPPPQPPPDRDDLARPLRRRLGLLARLRGAGMNLRNALHAWQTWVVIAYFFLALVTIALIHDDRRQVQDITALISGKAADADARYQACIGSIATFRHVNSFVEGVRGLSDVLLQNAIAAHKATAPNTDFYRAQEAAIKRLYLSKRLVRSVSFHVPTKGECAQRFVAEVGNSVTVPR